MLMAVDIGNTNIVIGFLEGDRIDRKSTRLNSSHT